MAPEVDKESASESVGRKSQIGGDLRLSSWAPVCHSATTLPPLSACSSPNIAMPLRSGKRRASSSPEGLSRRHRSTPFTGAVVVTLQLLPGQAQRLRELLAAGDLEIEGSDSILESLDEGLEVLRESTVSPDNSAEAQILTLAHQASIPTALQRSPPAGKRPSPPTSPATSTLSRLSPSLSESTTVWGSSPRPLGVPDSCLGDSSLGESEQTSSVDSSLAPLKAAQEGPPGPPNPNPGPNKKADKKACKRNAGRPRRRRGQRQALGTGNDLGVESEDEEEEHADDEEERQDEEDEGEEGQVQRELQPAAGEGEGSDQTLQSHQGLNDALGRQTASPPQESLGDMGDVLLSTLCTVSANSLFQTPQESESGASVHRLIRAIMGSFSLASSSAKDADSVYIREASRLAVHCDKLDLDEACKHAEYFFSTMMLAAMAQSEKQMGCKQKKEVVQAIINGALPRKISRSTILRMWTDGLTVARLSGAGSVYLILIMAAAKLRPELRLVDPVMVGRLAREIRNPNKDTASGKLIINFLIPAISNLRQIYPLTEVHLKLTPEFLSIFKKTTICLQDLDETDALFDLFKYNDMINDRNRLLWAPALIPVVGNPLTWSLNNLNTFLPSPLELPPLALKAGSKVVAVATKYDPAKNPAPKDLRNSSLMKIESERQRDLAEQAKPVKTVKALRSRLQAQVQSGKRKNTLSWTRFSTSIQKGETLRINDHKGDPLVITCPSLPSYLRQGVLDRVEAIFRNSIPLQERNTRQDSDSDVFKALHLSYYNRYSEKGTYVESHVDPATVPRLKTGKALPTSAKVPRPSVECVEYAEERALLQEALEPIFAWIRQTLKALLPEEFEILAQFTDCLPGGANSAVYPFSGLVINFNALTNIHRDSKDRSICIVMPLFDSQTSGGHLCIQELGLVIEMKSMDVVVFKSAQLTHFNLHYSGKRCSLVFHSDASGDSWVQDRNGWAGNTYIRST